MAPVYPAPSQNRKVGGFVLRTVRGTRAPNRQLMINQSAPTRFVVMLARVQAMEVVVASQNLIAWVKVGVGGSYGPHGPRHQASATDPHGSPPTSPALRAHELSYRPQSVTRTVGIYRPYSVRKST